MKRIEKTLEFDIIKGMLAEQAHSDKAKARLLALEPYLDEAACLRHAADTTAARAILDALGAPPLPYMEQLEDLLALAQAGSMLLPEQLSAVAQFVDSCRKTKRYLGNAATLDARIAPYGASIQEGKALSQEITRCIRHEQVDQHASATLAALRQKLERTQAKIKEKLASLLQNNKKWFSDAFITERNGRYVLPVKREYKNMVSGSVVEVSSSKSTYFVEPASVGKLQDEWNLLQIEEDAEVRKILYTLTVLVDTHAGLLRHNMAAMEELDVVFAKAKLSQLMGAGPVEITTGREIDIRAGRHPLLEKQSCVPLDFHLGGGTRGVIITGPNTGGKTVAIKAVGLLSMMAQSGLHVPAAPESKFAMHAGYFCDIGDGQSITENLSTFSGHITNIIGILAQATNESLVLLDELGSGTDPAEGMGIAIAVLEELREKGCLFLVTTHYAEVKEYAREATAVMSARMAFDRETLSPQYRLEQGEVGESCALYIAQRLGLPAHILQHAYTAAYPGEERKAARAAQAPAPAFTGGGSEAPVAQERSVGAAPRIRRQEPEKQENMHAAGFGLGDSVLVQPNQERGLVFAPANKQGEVGVQIKGHKQLINHKRLVLELPASELYPADYDFSILFDTVENRKARHQLEKGHRPGVEVRYETKLQ